MKCELKRIAKELGEEQVLNCLDKKLVEQVYGKLISVKSAAAMLKIPLTNLQRAMKDGKITKPAIRIKKRDFFIFDQMGQVSIDYTNRNKE